MELYLIGENLVQEIMMAREHAYDRPVILVGHGFGGVVLKRLCVHAQEKKELGAGGKGMDMFLESIRGFFFYGTPHLGVEGMQPLAETEGPLLRWMRVLNAESARLHETFSKMWRARYRWIIYGLGGYESTLQRHGHRVREASTRFGDNYITVPEDHVSVCRPSGKSDNRYLHLHNLIEDIQRQVELERKPPMMVPEVTVGVNSLLTEILGKHIRDHKFMGIFGMGGVGKTTVAKLIFNRMFAKSEFSCFVEEIKNIPGTREDVKKRVWEKMYRHGVPVCSASGSSGAGDWHQVMGRSLFVVFDDVEDTKDHVTLLKEIAHDGNEESRFILTSRNRNYLRDCGYICSLDTLEDDDAYKLFITYAFPERKEPPESLTPVVKEVVAGCKGLPLTLEVLGKYLKDIEEIDQSEEIPTALRECDNIGDLDREVWAKLQLSYDRLEHEEKYMFLDIASFFVFKDCPFSAEDAISAWTSIYRSGRNRLRTLEDRALVRISHWKDFSGNDRIGFYMHEHLRNMGQKLAVSEGRSFDLSRVRMSSASRYLYDDQVIFQGAQELGKIVAHRVQISTNSMRVSKQSCAFCIMREVWPKLTAIQYMELDIAVSDCCQECRNRRCPLPNTLVLFTCSLPFDLTDFVISEGVGTRGSLELTGCTPLVKLDLFSCGSVDLGGLNELQGLQNLNIARCVAVRNWPTSLGKLRNLKRLELLSVREPFELPSAFERLTNLEHLSIEDCEVTSVPNSFQLQNLKRLQVLKVDKAVGRQAIPNIIGFLQKLQILELKCWGIVNLVEGFRESTTLRELSLTCKGIEELPDTLGNLTNLEKLQLICPIKCLPASFSNLTRLETLKLDGGFGTVESMDGWQLSSRFREDSMDVEKVLKNDIFGKVDVEAKGVLVDLREDEIECPISEFFHPLQGFMRKQKGLILECQHGMSAVIVRNMIDLEVLKLEVTGPEAVPDTFGHLQKLRILKLTCGAMENGLVESLGRLSSLEELELVCTTVKRLPDVFHLEDSTLKTLGIKCPSLQGLPNIFASSSQLTTFSITGSGLWGLPISFSIERSTEFHLTGRNTPTTSPETIWLMSHLESLLLCGLPKLTMLLEALGNLHSLQKLECRECATKSLPGRLGQLTGMGQLKIEDCVNRETLPDTVRTLSSLDLWELTELMTLPEALGNLHSLRELELRECRIKSLPEFLGWLSCLRHLKLIQCDELETLPDTIGGLSNLESLVLGELIELTTLPEALGNLHSLQKLELRECGIESLPESLGAGTLTTLPEALGNLHSLQELELRECGIESLPESLGQLRGLKHLQIKQYGNLETLPDTIGSLSNLESLVLGKLIELTTLPEALGNLHSLQELKLWDCGIESLPESLGWLSCLRHLKITDCYGPETLPDTIRGLSNLESLVLGELIQLTTLPEALGNLHSLQKLELRDCGIESLPESLGRFTGLKHLEIKQCGNLETLPDTIGSLSNLESLVLVKLKNLTALPEVLGNLHSLHNLQLWHCRIESLPESLGWLSCLTHMKITDCDELETLPDTIGGLFNLESLVLGELIQLTTLPEALGNLHSLQKLELRECGIESLPESLGQLRGLKHLQIKQCDNLKTLPDAIGGLSDLESMVLQHLDKLMILPELLGNLHSLQKLELWHCNIKSLPESLGWLSCLRHLKITDCYGLETLPDTIGGLSDLESLVLGELIQLTTLPEALGNLHSLQKLELRDCGIESLPESLGRLTGLKHLEIKQCGNLKTLPDTIGSLSNLESLVLVKLKNLTALPEVLGNLDSLHNLELWHCRIESLPESLGWLSCLTHMKITDCDELETLPDTIGSLSSLTSLSLMSSSNLYSLPESLGRLSCLTDLKLHHCRRLNTLPKSIGDLSSLRRLGIYDCGLDYLPNTFWGLSNLISLSIKQCKGLEL
ncbi:hypothetical protein R1sor_025332 [Riccia sorocarpa]|uniref:NB-ARC domain-containing protein n=1 Tax=Riccia sorocarpa TaxID=122646 RepID=A0ABD3GC83_9MARC